ncbi:MAG: DNA repair protein RecO [Acidobacteriota bacterium]
MISGAGEGLVLRTWPLRESDRIVTILTEEHGKVRGVAHGATSPRSRWAGALEPLTEVAVGWRLKEGQDLVNFREVSLLSSPYRHSPSLETIAVLAFLAELADESTAQDDPDPLLLRLLRSCEAALRTGADPRSVTRFAQAWVLRLSGLLPELDACAACGADLGSDGGTWSWVHHGLACSGCVHDERETGAPARAEDLDWVRQTRHRKVEDLPVPSQAMGRRLGALLRGLQEEQLGKRLKSESFLERLL